MPDKKPQYEKPGLIDLNEPSQLQVNANCTRGTYYVAGNCQPTGNYASGTRCRTGNYYAANNCVKGMAPGGTAYCSTGRNAGTNRCMPGTTP